jgi:hypothetical protein
MNTIGELDNHLSLISLLVIKFLKSLPKFLHDLMPPTTLIFSKASFNYDDK